MIIGAPSPFLSEERLCFSRSSPPWVVVTGAGLAGAEALLGAAALPPTEQEAAAGRAARRRARHV